MSTGGCWSKRSRAKRLPSGASVSCEPTGPCPRSRFVLRRRDSRRSEGGRWHPQDHCASARAGRGVSLQDAVAIWGEEAVRKALTESSPPPSEAAWLWPSRGKQARGPITVRGAWELFGVRSKAAACRGRKPRPRVLPSLLDRLRRRLGRVPWDAMNQVGHRKAETHVGYRRNSTRAVSQEAVERVRVRRLRAAPRNAPQARSEQAQMAELTLVGAGLMLPLQTAAGSTLPRG